MVWGQRTGGEGLPKRRVERVGWGRRGWCQDLVSSRFRESYRDPASDSS